MTESEKSHQITDKTQIIELLRKGIKPYAMGFDWLHKILGKKDIEAQDFVEMQEMYRQLSEGFHQSALLIELFLSQEKERQGAEKDNSLNQKPVEA